MEKPVCCMVEVQCERQPSGHRGMLGKECQLQRWLMVVTFLDIIGHVICRTEQFMQVMKLQSLACRGSLMPGTNQRACFKKNSSLHILSKNYTIYLFYPKKFIFKIKNFFSLFFLVIHHKLSY